MNYKLLQKNAQSNPMAYHKAYSNLIEREIRKMYSLNDEIAVLRQAELKPEEFEQYNAYVELCKARVKAMLS